MVYFLAKLDGYPLVSVLIFLPPYPAIGVGLPYGLTSILSLVFGFLLLELDWKWDKVFIDFIFD
jgi:hypothetical protein